MSEEVTFGTLAQANASERARFYSDMFGVRGDWLAEHWRWWYRVGARPGLEPIVAFQGERMIGQAGVIPIDVEVRGRRELATWFVDFAIRPELQRQGLGKKLTEAWMALAPVQLTFCNEKSMGIFRRYGWSERFAMVRCGLPLGPERLLPSRFRGAARVLAPFYRLLARSLVLGAPSVKPEPIHRVTALADENGDVRVVRDAAWLEWRFLASPFAESLRCFRLGSAVAVVRGLSWEGARRLQLLLLGGGTERERAALIHGIVRWALSAEVDLVWYATTDARMRAALRAILPLQRPTRFAGFARDAEFARQLASGALAFQACDSDVDLIYVPAVGSVFVWD
jgi:GNAT superfamily N-acetyltransferase